jgi:toxin ParE1/3/4
VTHRVAPEAEADLDEIWLYIAQESGSLEIADRLIDSLTERFFLLSRNPYLGRRRDEELRPGLRSFPVGNYIIFYSIREEDVLILRVFRGSRDIQALLRR